MLLSSSPLTPAAVIITADGASVILPLECLPTQHDGSGIPEGGVGGGLGVGGGGAYKDTLSSLPQAAFNYINSIVGSGVIGIPYAFHKAGFGFGLLLLAFVAVITDYSLILMVSRWKG